MPCTMMQRKSAAVDVCGCVDKVLLELSDELVAPTCTGPAEIQVRYGLGLCALWRGISRSAASVGSPPDGIIDVVSPIVPV
jgi:hypothetical protein